MSEKQLTLPSQAGHWYAQNGEPRYTVIGKTTGRERPTTIKDARKEGWVPSVTAILGVADKPGLKQYFRRQMYDAAFTTPRPEGMSDEDHFKICCDWADEHALLARERGTELHTAIEDYIKGQANFVWQGHISKLEAKLEMVGIDLKAGRAEHSFASPMGYGGKTDYTLTDDPTVLDFKSKDKIEEGKNYSYIEHLMQLAAYGKGVGFTSEFRALNAFIGLEDENVRLYEYEWEDVSKAWTMFSALLTYWQLKNDYVPSKA